MFSAPITRRSLLASATAAVLVGSARAAEAGDPIRKLVIVSAAQASDPQEFQAAQLLAQAWRQLGLEIEVRGLPRPQLADLVWNTRDKWDISMWRMVGRPERSDPDEFAYNLFNPATAANGYDFVAHNDPGYMKIAEAQRAELDKSKRRQLLYEAQEAVDREQPYIFLVYPKNVLA
jgi:peptide/nickel transport system substrate-binding protein